MQITISEELLNLLVDAATHLPYRDAIPIFEKLSEELRPQEPTEPKIVIN